MKLIKVWGIEVCKPICGYGWFGLKINVNMICCTFNGQNNLYVSEMALYGCTGMLSTFPSALWGKSLANQAVTSNLSAETGPPVDWRRISLTGSDWISGNGGLIECWWRWKRGRKNKGLWVCGPFNEVGCEINPRLSAEGVSERNHQRTDCSVS